MKRWSCTLQIKKNPLLAFLKPARTALLNCGSPSSGSLGINTVVHTFNFTVVFTHESVNLSQRESIKIASIIVCQLWRTAVQLVDQNL